MTELSTSLTTEWIFSALITIILSIALLFLTAYLGYLITYTREKKLLHYGSHIFLWGIFRTGYFVLHMIALESKSSILERFGLSVYNLASIFFFTSFMVFINMIQQNQTYRLINLVVTYMMIIFQAILSVLMCFTVIESEYSKFFQISIYLIQYSYHFVVCIGLGIILIVFTNLWWREASTSTNGKQSVAVLVGLLFCALSMIPKSGFNLLRIILIASNSVNPIYTVVSFSISALFFDILPILVAILLIRRLLEGMDVYSELKE